MNPETEPAQELFEESTSDPETAPPTETSSSIPEIAQLEQPVESLIEQLGPKLEQGQYGLIIGDDASGRIPTLMIDRVMREIYRDHGLNKPETVFIAGSGSTSDTLTGRQKQRKSKDIESLLRGYDQENVTIPRRWALLVTDTVRTGTSLTPLATVLHEQGIPFDVASVGVATTHEEVTDIEQKLGAKIYYAEMGTPNIYMKTSLSGVIKSPAELHSRRYVDSIPGTRRFPKKLERSKTPGPMAPLAQGKINQARIEALHLSENILRRYRRRHPPKKLNIRTVEPSAG